MDDGERMPVAGLLLAAGAGRRMGTPKALVRGADGEAWVVRGARLLVAAGCSPVLVVLGAAAEEAQELLQPILSSEPAVQVVKASDWSDGMGVSLATGLRALDDSVDGVVITLVDLPDLNVEAIRRIIGVVAGRGAETALVQATYRGRPGHPVYIGRTHCSALAAELSGDMGARAFLEANGADLVDCTDLNSGDDVDSYPQ